MIDVVIYTTMYCGYCHRAKAILASKGVQYKEIKLDGDNEGRIELMQKTGLRTVPQIWVGDQHIGGCDELMVLDRSGTLDQMLTQG